MKYNLLIIIATVIVLAVPVVLNVIKVMEYLERWG